MLLSIRVLVTFYIFALLTIIVIPTIGIKYGLDPNGPWGTMHTLLSVSIIVVTVVTCLVVIWTV